MITENKIEFISEKQIKKMYALLRELELLDDIKKSIRVNGVLKFDKIEKSIGTKIISKLLETQNKTQLWSFTNNINTIKGKPAVCGQCSKLEQLNLEGSGRCEDYPWLALNGGSRRASYFGCFHFKKGSEPYTVEMRANLKKEILALMGLMVF